MAASTELESTEGMYSKLIDDSDNFRFEEEDNGINSKNIHHTVSLASSVVPNSRLYRLATMCLGFLCALLLISIIALSAHYKTFSVGSSEKHSSLSQNCSSAQSQLEHLTTNITSLAATLHRLQREKGEMEKERDRLHSRIAELEGQKKLKSCPQDWLLFNSSCYYISKTSKQWRDGQAFCAEKGGHLAIIHTPEEQMFIWNQLTRGHWNTYWLGISDDTAEGDWFWVDGTKLIGGFWMEGEPNNHIDEDCGYMVKTRNPDLKALGSWYDAPCTMFWPYICEAELVPATPATV